MNEKKLITPRKVQGFWELMPKEQILFSSMLDKIENVFKNNCFLPLDTPVLEYSEALLAKSGGETDKQVFRFTKGDADLCMRYDFTVPLARFVAMHKNELNFPFKRYQIGKNYRGERPQKGRTREFYQCDADIIGDGELSLVADAECIHTFEQCYDSIGLDVDIKVSNRKILAGFIEALGLADKSTEIFILLDKLDKIPETEAAALLQELGISQENSENLIKITKTSGNFEEIFKNLHLICENPLVQQGLVELQELDKHLKSLGTKNISYSLSVIRGHNYYTGTVFEAFLKGRGVALGGGGRFEDLCSYFSEKKMPGVGMSVGITRLFDILLQEGFFDISKTNEVEVAIIPFDETLPWALKVLSELRKNGIKADCFYENKSFKSKMKEANRRNIKFVLIVGEDEVKTSAYTLKDMETGAQNCMSISEIVKTVTDSRM